MLILPNSNDYVHVYFMQMESEEGGEKIKSVDCEEKEKAYWPLWVTRNMGHGD